MSWLLPGTQAEIAEAVGWSRGKVSQYAMLNDIDKNAWGLIATVFDSSALLPEKELVAEKATTVAISERILRPILKLTPGQLQKVDKNAWGLIVDSEKLSTTEVDKATLFNERILRPILKLTPGQQLGEGGKFSRVVAEKTAGGTTFFTQPFDCFKVARCRNMPR